QGTEGSNPSPSDIAGKSMVDEMRTIEGGQLV
ncbi:MAG: hypothetical protein QOH78_2715, partial [Verrucomicrobiota bacterium]